MTVQPFSSGSLMLAANAMEAVDLNSVCNFILAIADTSINLEAPMLSAKSSPSLLVTGFCFVNLTFFLDLFVVDDDVGPGGAATCCSIGDQEVDELRVKSMHGKNTFKVTLLLHLSPKESWHIALTRMVTQASVSVLEDVHVAVHALTLRTRSFPGHPLFYFGSY